MNPVILFFNINGSGLGHMNRCLSYARALNMKDNIFFFSLASTVEIIESFGFRAEYFVSPFWSLNATYFWNRELSYRFGMVLDFIRPDVIVFDGTWPFDGFLSACDSCGRPIKKIWSRRGLLKQTAKKISVSERIFDAILCPGEVGTRYSEERLDSRTTKFILPPVALLRDDEILSRDDARRELELADNGRYALFSLGPGNLRDVSDIGDLLMRCFRERGFEIVWAQNPISVKDVSLPDGARPLRVYPLARYMRAFDVFVGAAGYNTCCEVLQARVPALIAPNTLLADDQMRRALLIAERAPVVINACENIEEAAKAVESALALSSERNSQYKYVQLNGAEYAARAILRTAWQNAR